MPSRRTSATGRCDPGPSTPEGPRPITRDAGSRSRRPYSRWEWSVFTRLVPAVAVLGAPAAAVAEPDLHAADLAQVAEVALRGGPAHPGHLCPLRGRQLLPARGEQLLDGLQRVGGPALRAGQLILGPQRAEDPVDVALVGL